jgi:hypothetical protein
MKIRYQTGIATLIQFVTMTFLNIATGLVSIVSGCHDGFSDCLVNSFTSMAFFMIITLWFGFIWIIGFMAQDRRSKTLAQILIIAEIMIALVALFNARHHVDKLGLFTSLVDAALAVWVIYLAFRLMQSDGGRVVKKVRVKQIKNKDI